MIVSLLYAGIITITYINFITGYQWHLESDNDFIQDSLIFDNKGNLFVIASFIGSVYLFDSNGRTPQTYTSSSQSIVISKYSPRGDLTWFSYIYSPSNSDCLFNSMGVDSGDGLILLGSFAGGQLRIVDGTGQTHNVPISTGAQEVIFKYQSTGELYWYLKISLDSPSYSRSTLSIDSSNNIFVALTRLTNGASYQRKDMNNYVSIMPGLSAIAKFSSDGYLVNVKRIDNGNLRSIIVDDRLGVIAVAGFYKKSVQLDENNPNTTIESNDDQYFNGFIAKYRINANDTLGFEWSAKVETSEAVPTSLDFDEKGNVYVVWTIFMYSTSYHLLAFDAINHCSYNRNYAYRGGYLYYDTLLIKYSKRGRILSTTEINGAYDDYLSLMKVNKNNHMVYLSGYMSSDQSLIYNMNGNLQMAINHGGIHDAILLRVGVDGAVIDYFKIPTEKFHHMKFALDSSGKLAISGQIFSSFAQLYNFDQSVIANFSNTNVLTRKGYIYVYVDSQYRISPQIINSNPSTTSLKTSVVTQISSAREIVLTESEIRESTISIKTSAVTQIPAIGEIKFTRSEIRELTLKMPSTMALTVTNRAVREINRGSSSEEGSTSKSLLSDQSQLLTENVVAIIGILAGSSLLLIIAIIIIKASIKRTLLEHSGKLAGSKEALNNPSANDYSSGTSEDSYDKSLKTVTSFVSGNNSTLYSGLTLTNSSTTAEKTIDVTARTLTGPIGLAVPGFLRFETGLDFRMERELAQGGGGIVYIGRALCKDLQKYGNKIIIKETKDSSNSQQRLDAFYQEVSLMYLLREHPNIAKIVGYSESPYCIIMKFYPRGSLYDFLFDKSKRKTKSMQVQFMIDIANGIEFIFGRGVAHCDLKSSNILIDSKPNSEKLICLLTDFGISRMIKRDYVNVKEFRIVNVNGASISYASPESLIRLKSKHYGPEISRKYSYDPAKSDIYSFSIIAYQILHRNHIWSDV